MKKAPVKSQAHKVTHWEHFTKQEVEKNLKTNSVTGLKNDVAVKRLEKNGKNELPKAKTRPWYVTFLLSLVEPIQILLLIAAVISVVAPYLAAGELEFIDFSVIIAIVLIDAILETVQTVKARKSVDALKSLSKPISVVIRNGKQFEIEAADLVVGDLVVIEAGKYIPAELRIIEAQDFTVDESILTGESLPVIKHSNKIKETKILAERTNIAFMSTFAVSGRALGIVISTGGQTEIGKIAQSLTENADIKTPLEKKLTSFSYWISVFALITGVLIFIALYFSGRSHEWTQYLMIAITLAIGVIPESLSAVVSITLSVSTKRMAKEHVIVKKLASVETLGSVNVICTDKTGTLTQNKMTVKKLLFNNELLTDHEFIEKAHSDFETNIFKKLLVLPNDAITDGKERIGDPTELALIDFAERIGVDELKYRKEFIRLDEIPFDSQRKLMTTLNKISPKEKINFTKGAIDELLKKCNSILIHGVVKPLNKETKNNILKSVTKMSNDALRVLGFAYKESHGAIEAVESKLIFVGAVGMIDPVRESAIEAVREAHEAKIRVVMITGDHAKTALAIAKSLDIAYTEYEVMTSDVLEKMSDTELVRVIDNIRVFARVNPEHKVRIIQALQAKGNITSMTGDGVNDAPSLNIADIGVAMGISGTDVAKEAADVILTDDNFGTIMKGVNEGRNVYQKIRRTIVFLLGVNIANVLSILILSLINHVSPLEATDILWINLIVESLLAISMGMGPLDDNLMLVEPIKGKNGLLRGLGYSIIKIAIVLGAMEIASFYVGILIATGGFEVTEGVNGNVIYGQTALFITATLSPTFISHLVKLTNWKVTKKIDVKVNKALMLSSFIAIVLNTIIIFTPKISTEVFKLMSIEQWQEPNMFWILIASIGFSLVTPVGILIVDGILFVSYHYTKNPWNRNRDLVNKYVTADMKKAKSRLKNKKAA